MGSRVDFATKIIFLFFYGMCTIIFHPSIDKQFKTAHFLEKNKKSPENSEEKVRKLSNYSWINILFYGNVTSTKNACFWVKLYKKGVLQ